MGKRRDATDRANADIDKDGSVHPEVLAALEVMFPEFDAHELVATCRNLGEEHHRRLKLMLH